MNPQDLCQETQTYLASALGLVLPTPQVWPGVTALPRHLAERFTFYRLELWDKPVLLMLAIQEPPGANELQKLLRLVERLAGLPVLYGQSGMTARQRQRLVGLFLPFVVPGRQLFLPPLGLDLHEHYTAETKRHTRTLSPSAQTVLLGGLLGRWRSGEHGSVIARRFGYSAMTLSRVRRELLDIVRFSDSGRTTHWSLDGEYETLWSEALPTLRSPVLRRAWTRLSAEEVAKLPRAGLSALAEHSMLSPPLTPVHALSSSNWASLSARQPGLLLADEEFPDSVALELWSYEPRLLMVGEESTVDRYSLYLSLQDEAKSDERVAQALDEMMTEGGQ